VRRIGRDVPVVPIKRYYTSRNGTHNDARSRALIPSSNLASDVFRIFNEQCLDVPQYDTPA